MIQKVKGLIDRTGESIKGFGLDPINNLGFLIPMAICLTSIISEIVTYILFIVNGGYSSQVGSVKQNGLDGISEGFTSGTTGMMVSGIVSKIILALVVVELIVMLINYFKNRGLVEVIVHQHSQCQLLFHSFSCHIMVMGIHT